MTRLVWTAFLVASATPAGPPAAFVNRWGAALKGDSREAVLELMTPDAAVFESGGAESSRDEYAAQHLGADMAFARSTGAMPAEPAEPSPAMPPASSSAPAGAAPRDHLSLQRLISELKTARLKVERKGAVRQPFFAVPAQVLAIGADEIEVFEFASVQDAVRAAAMVSADGGTVGTSAMHWMAPPHFHRRGRTILIHLGNGAEVRSALERTAGAPFAGRP